MAAKIIFPVSSEILELRRIIGDDVNLHAKVDAVKVKTDSLPGDTAGTLATIIAGQEIIDTNVDAIKVKTDNLPANTATTLSGIEGKIDTVDTVVDAIKVKTDNLPTNTATTLSGIEGKIDTVDTVVDAIKVKTDNLPADTATVLTTLGSDVSAVKTKTDNLPANTSSVLGTPVTSLAGDIATSKTAIDAIKTKTDNLPANTATTLSGIEGKIDIVDTNVDGLVTSVGGLVTDVDGLDTKVGTPAALGGGTASVSGMLASLAGSGFAATDSLKDVKSAVLAIQNNTSFTASVVPIMEKPETGSSDYHALVNVYDGTGNLEDPDLNLTIVKVLNAAGTSRNGNLYNDPAQTNAATQIALHTITAPSVAPTAGATYTDTNATVLTVIGMIGTTTLVSSWTGVTAPVSGTLTRTSGTGDATLTSSAVDASYVKLYKEGVGQFHTFYNVSNTATKEPLAFRFGYFENEVFHAYDRASAVQDYESTATISGEVWEVLTSAHTTSGSFGLLVQNIAGTGFTSSTDSLHALKARFDTVDSALTNISGDLDSVGLDVIAIKAKTDNLPANTATSLTSIETKIDTVDTNVDAIKVKTDNLPANTSTVLGTPVTSVSADIAAVKSDTAAIKTKTDNLPADTATTLSGIETKIDTVDTVVDAIKVKTDNLPANTSTVLGTPVNGSVSADIADVKASIIAQSSYPTTFGAVKSTAAIAAAASQVLQFSTAEGVLTKNSQLSQLKITVTGSCSNFKVEIFEKTGAPSANKIYEVQEGDVNGLNLDLNSQVFRNADDVATNIIYVKISSVADAGNSTFSVELRGIVNAA